MVLSRILPLGFALSAFVPASAQASALAMAGRNFDGSQAVERIRAADTNHDGTVSRAELGSYRKSQWQRLDRNGDGYFSQGDLPRFVRDRWNGEKLAGMRATYDRNKDGRISRDEFISGPTPAFDLADTNNDNRVTEAELKALLAAAGN
ncbi:EF-hand domain-containing protein [Novosphingobium mangrovi (ex Huang et al. 2023)]|uniref:EF-hand domain-containing protein n=1 Tax=Novosphingobium mangrovi (ex Huang et al. 2023) TaxID=2976432 RepID=A0ABT2I981_9SPHN|nr:EF-hand domain-containing protein [Novosphingobium mangrovi (ex Huang et al. 2023)]MCT2401390.1 EF-hand domain-containing protein [Novosphingobium mangrovi (ex Huang et al. 2023)]